MKETPGARGAEITGIRVESVTYVAEQEGAYRLPAIELAWWDVSAEQLRRSSLPAIEFLVTPNTELVADIPLPPDSLVATSVAPGAHRIGLDDLLRRWGMPLAVGCLAVLFLFRLVRRFGPRARRWIGDVRRRRAASESTAFARFDRAARSGDPRAAVRHLFFWLDRAGGQEGAATFHGFAAEAGDAELDRQGQALGRLVFGPDADSASKSGDAARWSGKGFAQSVATARKRRRQATQRRQASSPLPPLNPGR